MLNIDFGWFELKNLDPTQVWVRTQFELFNKYKNFNKKRGKGYGDGESNKTIVMEEI